MTTLTRGRKPNFKLETPRDLLWIPALPFASSVAQADRALLRSGYWLLEEATTLTGPDEAQLVKSTGTRQAWPAAGASVGMLRCISSDPDSDDALFAEAVPLIHGHDWKAQTKVFVAASIAAGDMLAVVEGDAATGNYGHLQIAAAGDIGVAVARFVNGAWLGFTAVAPFKVPA